MTDIPSIIAGLKQAATEVSDWFSAIPDAQYTAGPEGKWAAWQHLDHLIKTTAPLARTLRKDDEWFSQFGEPNRNVRTNEEVIERFTFRYNQVTGDIPDRYKPMIDAVNRSELLAQYQEAMDQICEQLGHWSEERLDSVLIPHPLMGRLIFREMLYFTVFHQYHHLKNLKSNYTQYPTKQS